jgi:RimJ/RimL family protein N-acetyltransferase
MENLPVIMRGTKVVLTSACREDVPAYLRWITDPELNVFLLDYGKVSTLEQEYAWYDDVVAKASSHHLVQLAIRLAGDQKLIGNCCLGDINYREGTAEVAILVGEKEYHSKGYGSEALYLLCRYGFDKLNLHTILLRHLSINTRGDKAYRKIGFREFGCFRESVVRDRVRYDMVYMDLLESELRNPPAGEG